MRQRMLEIEHDRYKDTEWALELKKYPTPNSLAEAISSEDVAVAEEAKTIFLTSEIGAQKRLAEWFLSKLYESAGEERESYFNRIAAILTTSNLNDEFVQMTKTLQLPDRVIHQEKSNTMGLDCGTGGKLAADAPGCEKSEEMLSALAQKNAEALLVNDYALLKEFYDRGLLKTEDIRQT